MLFCACAMLVGMGLLLGVPVLRRRALVRHREQHPALYGPVEFTFGADGLRIASALATTDVPWSSLDRAYEANGLFLFRLAGSTAYFVPRRALRENDEPRLRALVAAHLGPRAELTNPTDGR
jgi:hypothetical protein